MKADRYGLPVKALYPPGWFPTTAGDLHGWRRKKGDFSELERRGNAKLIAAERRFGHVKEIARVQSAVA